MDSEVQVTERRAVTLRLSEALVDDLKDILLQSGDLDVELQNSAGEILQEIGIATGAISDIAVGQFN